MKSAPLFAAVLLVATVGTAMAKDATCFTTDDGKYPCEFVSTGSDGSFDISAPGKPSFSLVMDGPGAATVFATYEAGGRSVALPGSYQRSTTDPACWDNADTSTQICAW
jgi:hypothetical protein